MSSRWGEKRLYFIVLNVWEKINCVYIQNKCFRTDVYKNVWCQDKSTEILIDFLLTFLFIYQFKSDQSTLANPLLIRF